VITNAIYFKGSWEHCFFEHSTSKEDFHLVGNSGTVKADMMHKTITVPYKSFSDYDMVQLPYKGQEMAMFVLLPHTNSYEALDQVNAVALPSISNQLTKIKLIQPTDFWCNRWSSFFLKRA